MCGSCDRASRVAALRLELRDRGAHAGSRDRGIEALAEVLARARRCAGPSRSPIAGGFRSFRSAASTLVESCGSRPEMTSRSRAALLHVARERPDLVEARRERDRARSARRGRRSASRPTHAAVSAAGCRIEPPVSLPSDAGQRARLPPPRRCRRSSRPECASDRWDSSAGPKALFSLDEPIANSSMLVLPTMIGVRHARSRATTVASNGGRKPCAGSELADLVLRGASQDLRARRWSGASRVHSASLIAIGTPASVPSFSPRRAARRAPSRSRAQHRRSRDRKAFRSRCCSMRSSALASELDGGDVAARDRGGQIGD